jgi:hypothetical protein
MILKVPTASLLAPRSFVSRSDSAGSEILAAGYPYRQTPSVETFDHRRQAVLPQQPATSQEIPAQHDIHLASFDRLDSHADDPNGLADFAVDQFATDLATIKDRMIFCGRLAAGIESANPSISVSRHNTMGIRHCQCGGDHRVSHLGLHQRASLPFQRSEYRAIGPSLSIGTYTYFGSAA